MDMLFYLLANLAIHPDAIKILARSIDDTGPTLSVLSE